MVAQEAGLTGCTELRKSRVGRIEIVEVMTGVKGEMAPG